MQQRRGAAACLAAALRGTLIFCLNTQTSLVAAGDRPSVGPSVLTDWARQLVETGDADALDAANACRAALARRGYDLHLHMPTAPPLTAVDMGAPWKATRPERGSVTYPTIQPSPSISARHGGTTPHAAV